MLREVPYDHRDKYAPDRWESIRTIVVGALRAHAPFGESSSLCGLRLIPLK